jgi:prolyl oligopeptidase
VIDSFLCCEPLRSLALGALGSPPSQLDEKTPLLLEKPVFEVTEQPGLSEKMPLLTGSKGRWPIPANGGADELRFGKKIHDPQAWLNDVDSPQAKAYLEARAADGRSRLDALPHRAQLTDKFKNLLYVDQEKPPMVRGDLQFVQKQSATEERPVLYVRTNRDGKLSKVLDANDKRFPKDAGVTDFVPSPDGSKVAFFVRPGNADECQIHVLDVKTGKLSRPSINATRFFPVEWSKDGKGFFYTWFPDEKVPLEKRMAGAEIRHHSLGSDGAKDPVIHGASGSSSNFLSCNLEGKYLVVTNQKAWERQTIKVLDTETGQWTTLADDVKALAKVKVLGDQFFITTDEGASNKRVFVAQAGALDRSQWKEIVKEQPEAVIEGVSLVGQELAIKYLRGASHHLQLHSLAGEKVREVQLPAPGTIEDVTGTPKGDLYFTYSSTLYPNAIYRAAPNGDRVARPVKPVKSPLDPKKFEFLEKTYPSKDGETRVPMFLVRPAGQQPTGDHPLYVYAYGGFGVTNTPRWNPLLVPLLEAGVAYSELDIRGGGNKGAAWHDDGILLNAQHGFDDHQAGIRHLQQDLKVSNPARTVAAGESNGGKLVGVLATQAPELADTIIATVPMTDMERYDRFGMGATWKPEYGDPAVAELYWNLRRYSPFAHADQWRAEAMIGLERNDHRVGNQHPLKLDAELVSQPGAPEPLLRVGNGGHLGASTKEELVLEYVDRAAFAMHRLGVKPA